MDIYIQSSDPKKVFYEDIHRIIKQGVEDNVYFYTEDCEHYVIESPSPVILNSLDISELQILLPKFGKYEVEEFFMNRFLTAILITKDASDLFNTTVLCVDSIWSCKFEKERIRKIFLEKTFSIVSKKDNVVTLKLNL